MVWIPQWLNTQTLKDFGSWLVDNVAADVIVGVIVGIILILISQISIKKWREKCDKKQIYDWLCGKTKHPMPYTVGSPFDTISWPSTEEISSAIDLTEERVHYICTIDKRIQRQEKSDLWPNQELEERWAVRKFVRDY